MQKITASDIVRSINALPKNKRYSYINERNHNSIKIVDVTMPEGPIRIKRYDAKTGQSSEATISSAMIWRVANAIIPKHPFMIDRILGASFNTRSVLESLMAHTPEFYVTLPGRIEKQGTTEKIKKGHKHLIWLVDEQAHDQGVIETLDTDLVISEIPAKEVIYDNLDIDIDLVKANSKHEGKAKLAEEIEQCRRHAQIQIALIKIGEMLEFQTYVASNDQGIMHKGKPLLEQPCVLGKLQDIPLLSPFPEIAKAGKLIDCIWFSSSGKRIPAVIEIEHSTGVTSGLTRMKGFKEVLPDINTRYVIAAPDETREAVFRKASNPQFSDMNLYFFPYSSVEELYAFCAQKLTGITDAFIENFMEKIE